MTPDSTALVQGGVAFTDIVGFTEYTAVRGDGAALELVSAQDRIVRESLPPDARVVKELGDGLMLWFPEACSALEACVTLRQRFEQELEPSMLPLWVRIGMHWGQSVRRGDDLIGHSVNVAARIVDVAGPGELLVSEQAVREVDGRVRELALEELAPVVMKGIPEPVRLYRVTRAGEASNGQHLSAASRNELLESQASAEAH